MKLKLSSVCAAVYPSFLNTVAPFLNTNVFCLYGTFKEAAAPSVTVEWNTQGITQEGCSSHFKHRLTGKCFFIAIKTTRATARERSYIPPSVCITTSVNPQLHILPKRRQPANYSAFKDLGGPWADCEAVPIQQHERTTRVGPHEETRPEHADCTLPVQTRIW